LVGALDLLPALAHAARRPGFGVAEHVWVPADELLVHEPCDLLEVGGAALLQQQREEVDLEEEVTELVGELRVVALDGGVGDLVRLLEGMRDDRALGLLAVPGAFAPQALRQFLQIDERLGEAQATARSRSSRSVSRRDPDSAGSRSGT